MKELLKIGQLAKKMNISSDTIRYYESMGLLTPSSYSNGGYRLYNEQTISILEFILFAKVIGFTLQEIKQLLEIDVNKTVYSCKSVKQLIDNKHKQIQQRISDLQHIEQVLGRLSQSCCGGSESADNCSILAAIESGKPI